jgi:hypothetical protein
MGEQKSRALDLTDPELKKLLGICAKELIPQLHHNTIEPELVSLLEKAAAALAPEAKEDAKDNIPG